MAQVDEIKVLDADGLERDVATLTALIKKLGPATSAEVVTPHNSNNFSGGTCRAIWVGTGGDVTAVIDGVAVLHANVPSGTRLDFEATRVNATGTDAEDMVAWF